MKAAPEAFLKAVAPYRDGWVVAVECLFTWYWLADLCADQGIPFVLGHALYMKAMHGGKAKNDKIDSQKIAALRRGGILPQADVYPAQMRATRLMGPEINVLPHGMLRSDAHSPDERKEEEAYLRVIKIRKHQPILKPPNTDRFILHL